MNTVASTDNGNPPPYSRRDLRAPLIIQKVRVDSERPVFFGYSKNISRSGLFIATTNPIETGQQLELEIPLPESVGGAVRCHCEVVWRRPFGKHLPFEPGMGVRFIDMPEDIAKRIDDWLEGQSIK